MPSRSDEPWVQLATRIPKELHRRLKLHCVQTDTSVMDFVVSALEKKLEKAGGRERAGRSALRRSLLLSVASLPTGDRRLEKRLAVIADEAVGDAALGAAGLIAAGTHGDRTSEGACRARAALRGSAAREDAPGGGTSGRNVLFHHERTFTRVGAADAEAKAGRF